MNSFLKRSSTILNYSKTIKGNLTNIPKFGFLTNNIIKSKASHNFQSFELNLNKNEIKKQSFLNINRKFFSENKDNKEPEKKDEDKNKDKDNKEPEKDDKEKDQENKDKDKDKENKENKEKTEEEKQKEKEKGRKLIKKSKKA